MKIAFLIWRFPVVYEASILNQITGLIDMGHEVDIFSFEHGDMNIVHPDVKKYGLLARTTYLWSGGRKLNFFDRIKTAPRVLLNLLAVNPKVALYSLSFFHFGRRAVSLSALFWASRMVGRGPYDIIHCQFGELGLEFLPFYCLELFGGKIIVQFRGHDITEIVKKKGNNTYTKLFQEADYFLPVCDYFREKAIEFGCPEGKISVLRSSIDCKLFKFLERKKPKNGVIKISFVGRLVEKKGVEYAIHAISILKNKNYKVEFLIVGAGPLRGKLQDLCKDLGIEKNVFFLGPKNHEELVKVLKAAHIFVAPSVTSINGDEEGIPNALKEAVATGLPVVSTYHAGIPELVEDGVSGFLVPERNEEALAERLSFLIDHPEIWIKMGRAGRKFVEKNYDKEKLNRQLVDIYKSLIS